MKKVLIVGGGLSGLCTAYALGNSKFQVELLEARPRLGGRIFTQQTENFHLELGATWFGPQHTSLLRLIQSLKIPYKTQDNGREVIYDFRPKGNLERFQIPKQATPTFKFKHGTSSLIEALQNKITAKIHQNEAVKSVKFDANFKVTTEHNQFEADYVVMSIPPQLIADSIHFEPSLPQFQKEVLETTHTWMSDSIKFSLAFSSPFWKSKHFIGTMMSPQQIIQEMYDHSDDDFPQNALVGFLNSSFSEVSIEQRKASTLEQLKTIFPNQTDEMIAYKDVDWSKEVFTIAKNAQLLAPHQNNGHPGLRKAFFDDRLYFSASETSAQTPGYMDGAVHRGIEVAEQILKTLA